MAKQPKIPITRANKFFAGEDFRLEVELGREYIEGDLNMTVVLYRVDLTRTEGDDIYGEAAKDNIQFLAPIELKVIATIEEPTNKSYNDNGTLRYLEDGNLTFNVYSQQLEELEVDIKYGDYIGYPIDEKTVKYFSVTNDGLKNYNNANTMVGYKSFHREIVCVPIDENEFNGM